jgi:2-keto-4-pentenoate hydratase
MIQEKSKYEVYSVDKAGRAADLLAQARFTKRTRSCLPEDCRPPTPPEGYAVQDMLVQRLLSNYGGHPVGYKIACTSKSAQELLNLEEPFYGRLLSPFVHKSPACMDPNDFFMRVVEPEFAFEMRDDLPASGRPYDTDTVAAAVGAILPAIEIADSRYAEWTVVDGPSLIADNGCNGAWIRGETYPGWRACDLATHEVALVVNGKSVRQGRGDVIMGHPINALTWLANMLSRLGSGLKAGDLISTGTCTEMYLGQAGDEICADFGSLGIVELTFGSTRKGR